MRALALSIVACGICLSGCGGSTPIYDVLPGAGIEFSGSEWGFAITAGGQNNWVVTALGDPSGAYTDRFSGTIYTTQGNTISDVAQCDGCDAAGVTVVDDSHIDFDTVITGPGVVGFSFNQVFGDTHTAIYADLLVDGSHFGSWQIYFTDNNTGNVATSPDDPVGFQSP